VSEQDEALEWMTSAEARALLGVGRSKMGQWIKSDKFKHKPSEIDGRVTLVWRADVEKLLRSEPHPKGDALLAA
jgi:Helix-turn-helix domain